MRGNEIPRGEYFIRMSRNMYKGCVIYLSFFKLKFRNRCDFVL